jgi:cellulose synthase/poly-beta-1,6-N-acetylglucosamine synthase-like glycosyltransferase
MELVTALVILITLYSYVLAAVSSRAQREPAPAAGQELFFVLLVPVLNEERVIARTLTSLLGLRGSFLALVVDDASDDGTVEAIKPFLSNHRVRLLQRPPEDARLGKGAVLNAGYAEIRRLGLAERYGPENVIVVVFDADGRVDPNFLQEVSGYFQHSRVAGVQSAVRMYNAERNLLTFWQDFEFVVWGELVSRARDRLGSATLGGNGQSVRLSALQSLGPEPWRASLTEDLDLSLRLLAQGWRLRFCPTVAVWQEALPGFRALVRQRSRWLQGHLVAWSELPALLRGRLAIHTRVDLALFLLLPASFLPIGLASIGSWGLFWLDFGRWDANALLAWYALGFGAAPVVAEAWSRAGHGRLGIALLRGHAYVFYSFVWFLASVVAAWNVLLGRRAWAKTSRAATVRPGDSARPRYAGEAA